MILIIVEFWIRKKIFFRFYLLLIFKYDLHDKRDSSFPKPLSLSPSIAAFILHSFPFLFLLPSSSKIIFLKHLFRFFLLFIYNCASASSRSSTNSENVGLSSTDCAHDAVIAFSYASGIDGGTVGLWTPKEVKAVRTMRWGIEKERTIHTYSMEKDNRENKVNDEMKECVY